MVHKEVIENFVASYGIWFYAIAVTIIAVFATIWVTRVSERIKR